MATPRDRDDPFDSTLVRRGTDAARLSEVAQFVTNLEARPFDKLAADLAGFIDLSGRKFDLVTQVVRRRLRDATQEDRRSFRRRAVDNAAKTDADRAKRIGHLLDDLGV